MYSRFVLRVRFLAMGRRAETLKCTQALVSFIQLLEILVHADWPRSLDLKGPR